MALLAVAPVAYVLVTDGKFALAVLCWLGISTIEPLPDSDFALPFLDHRGVSHSLLAVGVVGGALGAIGWFLGGNLFDLLLAALVAGADGGGWILGQLPDASAETIQLLLPNISIEAVVGDAREIAGESVNQWTFAVYGLFVGGYGVFVHLLGDVITTRGIKPFLPISGWQLSLTPLRADSPAANSGLFGLGVLAIAVVLVATVPGALGAGMPADLSPIGVADAQDSSPQNGSVTINSTGSNRTQIALTSVTLPRNGYIVVRTNVSANQSGGTVVGHTQYVRNGTFQDVVLNLNKTVNKSQTVSVTIHNDTNGNQTWDGVKTDTPYLTSGETPVHDTVRLGGGQQNTSQSQNTASTNATVEFANQTSNGSTVTVERVTLPESGFVVLDSTGPAEEGVLEESAIAVSQRLSAGTHRNVTLQVNRSPPGGLVNRTTLNSTGTYEALLYQDSNNNSRFEYITSGRSADKPFVIGSGSSARLAADPARITLPQPQTPTPTASVRFTNQSTTGSTVTIRSVTLPDGGFLVVHNQNYLRGGDPLATIAGHSTYLSSGTHRNVTISLNRSIEQSRTFVVTPSRDSNGNQRYDYVRSDGFQDVPYTSDSGTITDQAIVRQASDGTPPSSTATRATSTATRSSSAPPNMNAPDTGEAASGGVGSWIASHPLETAVAVLAVLVLPTLVRRFKA
jgi:membrane-bound metal-dependent hydrolase YbcI (DUF457 family)